MLEQQHTTYIRQQLRNWYLQCHRQLPWRETCDPYCIWISEVILQQTRVAQGLDYYLRFMTRFPDVRSLAEADEDEVLRLWQGLGYYSRARHLHAAAKTIMQTHRGVFPHAWKEVRALKGVGDYTAAAICSIAYGQPYAVVDGNVYRVLARLANDPTPIDSTAGKQLFAAMAHHLLDPQDPRTHNQAMMELGAMQCVPGKPACDACPLLDVCRAAKAGTAEQLPYKEKKTKVRERFFHYIYLETPETTFLQRRTEKDIWHHLYEPPLIETDHLLTQEELMHHPAFLQLTRDCGQITFLGQRKTKHILSHQRIHAQLTHLSIEHPNAHLQPLQVDKTKLDDYPVPRLVEILW